MATAAEPTLTPRAWYLVAAGLIVSAVTMALIAYSRFTDNIEGMQRVVMPGTAEITLPMGASTLYAESRSVVGDERYEADDVDFSCALDRGVTLKRANGSSHYQVGDFAGRNAFDVMIPDAGTYTLTCEAKQPFVIAVGRGLGAWIVIAAVGLLPFTGGVIVILFVFLRRRRQLRARDRMSQ
jgi:hypothetical protein